ncbi:MAG: ABC transporter permease, partial [Bacteroidota bacterium]
KTAFRNLTKNKMYTLINILGLTVGMTCFILIALYVQYEMSYDQQHEKADQIYRIAQQQKGNTFKGTDYFAVAPIPITAALMDEFPEVEAATSMQLANNLFSKEEKVFFEEGIYADTYFFEVFSVPVIEGEGKTALEDPNSIILTQSLAEKYFGQSSPIGQTLLFRNEQLLTVKGVIEDVPKNQHFTYDYISPIQNYLEYDRDQGRWGSNNYKAYVRLQEGVNHQDFTAKMNIAFAERVADAYSNAPFSAKYFLDPIKDIHLYSNINFEPGKNSDIRYIYLFTSLAFIILLLAAINYMNLATARSARRSKEVGVRKVLGAKKGQLIYQLLGESFLLTLLSFLLAIALASFLLPFFNNLVGIKIPFQVVGNQWLFVGMLVVALLIGGLSGLYPSVVLSSINPVKAFRGSVNKSYKDGTSLRNILVVGQFVTAIVLGTGGMIVYGQLQYIQNKKLGYNREQVMYIDFRDNEVNKKANLIEEQLLQHPNIQKISFARNLPLNTLNQGVIDEWEGNEEKRNLWTYRFFVDENYIDLFEIDLVEGRNFSSAIPTDSTDTYILNETAVKAIGWESAIGKGFRGGKVIGVVKDYHFQPFDLAIEPLFMAFRGNTSDGGNIIIKAQTDDLENTVAHIQNTMKTLIPQYPYEVEFMDETFNNLYESEQRFGKAFNIFTLLALFIACMGLFGLVSHHVLQRTKEIGIRKVLGASVSSIVALLSKDFLRLIIIAFVIAIPITYYAMNQWLENFAYHIDIQWWVFALTGIGAIGVAFLTVSAQSIKAALTNPINSLRNE